MKIWIRVPEYNEVMPIHMAIRDIVYVARKYFDPKKTVGLKRRETCESCGAAAFWYRKNDVHHIRPLWVYALESFLAPPIKTDRDLRERAGKVIDIGHALGARCHKPENLVVLCKKCHSKAESAAYKKWVDHYEAQGVYIGKFPED